MRLSPHFTLAEFLRSQVAVRNGIDMTPSAQVRSNLERLANEVLEPIRAALCRAFGDQTVVQITSGYRPSVLNLMVGGAPGSDHVEGRAADFVVPGRDHSDVVPVVMAAIDELPVSKCIDEFDAWTHASLEKLGRIPTRRKLFAFRTATGVVYRDWSLDA